MEEEHKQISWNPALEVLIAQEGERAAGLAWLHSKCENRYSQLNTYIALPVICLSTLNGFVSGSSSMLFNDPAASSIGVGGVSLFTAMLSTVGTFFAWAKRTEAHRISAIQYSKLSKFISIELSLPRCERMRAKDMLKMVRESTDRLMEISPLIPDIIKNQFNDKFESSKTIAKPEITNGIHKIEVNSHTNVIPTPKTANAETSTLSNIRIEM